MMVVKKKIELFMRNKSISPPMVVQQGGEGGGGS